MGCAPDALEVTDGYAVVESSVEAELLAWHCHECGDSGEAILPLLAEDLAA